MVLAAQVMSREECNCCGGLLARGQLHCPALRGSSATWVHDVPPTRAPVRAISSVMPTTSTPKGVAHSLPLCVIRPCSCTTMFEYYERQNGNACLQQVNHLAALNWGSPPGSHTHTPPALSWLAGAPA